MVVQWISDLPPGWDIFSQFVGIKLKHDLKNVIPEAPVLDKKTNYFLFFAYGGVLWNVFATGPTLLQYEPVQGIYSQSFEAVELKEKS